MPRDIVEFSKNRLMIDPWEYRVLPNHEIVAIYLLARAVHAGRTEKPRIISVTPKEAILSALQIPYYDAAQHPGLLSDLTMRKPLLAYHSNAEGRFILIDGMQRAAKALAKEEPRVTIWVVREEDLVQYGVIDSGGRPGMTLADLQPKRGRILNETLRNPVRDIHSPNFQKESIVARVHVSQKFPRKEDKEGPDGYNHTSLLLEVAYILNFIELTVAEEVRRKQDASQNAARQTRGKIKFDREEFLRDRKYNGTSVPIIFGYGTLRDRANEIVRHCTKHSKNKDYEKEIFETLEKLSPSDLREEIAYLGELHGQFGRALRHSIDHTIRQNELHRLESEKNHSLGDIADFVAGSVDSQKMTSLNPREKFQVAINAGVNPADFYPEDTFFGGLLSWAKMLPVYRQGAFLPHDLMMAEIYADRRALALAGEQDHMSKLWDFLFYAFSEIPAAGLEGSIFDFPIEDFRKDNSSLLDYLDWVCIEALIAADNAHKWTDDTFDFVRI